MGTIRTHVGLVYFSCRIKDKRSVETPTAPGFRGFDICLIVRHVCGDSHSANDLRRDSNPKRKLRHIPRCRRARRPRRGVSARRRLGGWRIPQPVEPQPRWLVGVDQLLRQLRMDSARPCSLGTGHRLSANSGCGSHTFTCSRCDYPNAVHCDGYAAGQLDQYRRNRRVCAFGAGHGLSRTRHTRRRRTGRAFRTQRRYAVDSDSLSGWLRVDC